MSTIENRHLRKQFLKVNTMLAVQYDVYKCALLECFTLVSLKVLIMLAVHMTLCINTYMKSQATLLKELITLPVLIKVHIINTYGI